MRESDHGKVRCRLFSATILSIYIHIKKKKENITDKTQKCDRLTNRNYLKKKKKKRKKEKELKKLCDYQ